jgi:hypothetical protein
MIAPDREECDEKESICGHVIWGMCPHGINWVMIR